MAVSAVSVVPTLIHGDAHAAAKADRQREGPIKGGATLRRPLVMRQFESRRNLVSFSVTKISILIQISIRARRDTQDFLLFMMRGRQMDDDSFI